MNILKVFLTVFQICSIRSNYCKAEKKKSSKKAKEDL